MRFMGPSPSVARCRIRRLLLLSGGARTLEVASSNLHGRTHCLRNYRAVRVPAPVTRFRERDAERSASRRSRGSTSTPTPSSPNIALAASMRGFTAPGVRASWTANADAARGTVDEDAHASRDVRLLHERLP